jgi:uncharacterized protein YecE (DUF72 family)
LREENREYFLGCSGYFYWSWKGRFYPPELEPREWLRFYTRHFNTVEINSTFYRFPKKSSLRRMARETPENFLFALKMNRTVTHLKKLRDCRDLVEEFLEIAVEGLDGKMGPVLFQLPPSFRYSEENLSRVIDSLASVDGSVVEFRHHSWWREEVFEVLKSEGITFCSVSLKGLPDDIRLTTSTLYLRFHGLEGKYRYRYSDEELKDWAIKIKSSPAERVYVYFNNDYRANAPDNCRILMDFLGLRQGREGS